MTKHRFVHNCYRAFEVYELKDVLFHNGMEFEELRTDMQRLYDGTKGKAFAATYDMALCQDKLESLLVYCKNERPNLDWS